MCEYCKEYREQEITGNEFVMNKTAYDGHSGIVIKHFKPTGRDMMVHIQQEDGRIWYCPDNNITSIEEDKS